MNESPIKNGFGSVSREELERIKGALIILLQEFDSICREHGITYYLDGGSVIGALRHKGFIPWDDDVDILIKKEEFDRLRPILERLGREKEGRCFSYLLSDYSHHHPFARYINTDVPCILGNSVVEANYLPGVFLDIFILDGVEAKSIDKYRKALESSEEWFHWRLNGVVGRASLFEYGAAMLAERFLGEKSVATYYINKLESFEKKSKKVDFYVPRNGFNYAVYDADVFQEPKYIEFEGGLYPVPTKPEKYLRAHYSVDWFNMPSPEDRYSHHFVLTSEIFSPAEFRDYYNWQLEQDKVHDVQKKRHFFQVLRKPFVVRRQRHLAKLHCFKYELELRREVVSNFQIEYLDTLAAAGEYSLVCQVLTAYFSAQKRVLKLYPLCKIGIPMPDAHLHAALRALVMTGREYEAFRYVRLYSSLGDQCKGLYGDLQSILSVECAIQDGELVRARQLLERLPEYLYDAISVFVYRYRLGLVSFPSARAMIDHCNNLMLKNGRSYDVLDLMADTYSDIGEYGLASDLYSEIIERHSNGLVVIAAKEKLVKVKAKLGAGLE